MDTCPAEREDLLESYRARYEIMQEYDNDIEKAVEVLIDRANYYGGTDNIAALIVDCRQNNP